MRSISTMRESLQGLLPTASAERLSLEDSKDDKVVSPMLYARHRFAWCT